MEPALVAARAEVASPSGQSSPASPVGGTMSGMESRRPNNVVERSRSSAPPMGRG